MLPNHCTIIIPIVSNNNTLVNVLIDRKRSCQWRSLAAAIGAIVRSISGSLNNNLR